MFKRGDLVKVGDMEGVYLERNRVAVGDKVIETEDIECYYCRGHSDSANCKQQNSTGLICTRLVNHVGNHVACGVAAHGLAEWS